MEDYGLGGVDVAGIVGCDLKYPSLTKAEARDAGLCKELKDIAESRLILLPVQV
jgi:hypothetical protein